jgi:hypothetical protein
VGSMLSVSDCNMLCAYCMLRLAKISASRL